jgi:hypothetical protein
VIWSARESTTVETISYGIGESALGEVLIARTVLGVCAILMGTENDKLVKDLAASFPEAKLVANEHAVHYDLAKLLRFLNKPSEGLDLALDLRGTEFQPRLANVTHDPDRENHYLRRFSPFDRSPALSPRRRGCLCVKSDRDRRSMPSRRGQR